MVWAMNKNSSRFEGLLSRYFEKLLEDEPRFAVVSGGLASGEGKLGQMTLEHQRKREHERQLALRALEQVSPRELSSEQQLDRLALRSFLHRDCEDYARNRQAIEPNAPGQLLDILLHELMRGDDEPQRAARNLRSLLRQAPDFLEGASSVVQSPERVWLKIMEDNVAGSAVLLAGVGELLRKPQRKGDDRSGRGALSAQPSRPGSRRGRNEPARGRRHPNQAPAMKRCFGRRSGRWSGIRSKCGADRWPGQFVRSRRSSHAAAGEG